MKKREKGQAVVEWAILATLIIMTWAGMTAFAFKALARSRADFESLIAARRKLSSRWAMQGKVNQASAWATVDGVHTRTVLSVPERQDNEAFSLRSLFPSGSWFSQSSE